MKRAITLTFLALVASSVIATDPSRSTSMGQQGPMGLEQWRLSIRKLTLGMSDQQAEEIVGFRFEKERSVRLRPGMASLHKYEKNGYIWLEFRIDDTGWRLTDAHVIRDDKVIAKLNK